jgi:hypothetical protein
MSFILDNTFAGAYLPADDQKKAALLYLAEDSISRMSHEEMARSIRFAPSGDPLFDDRLPLYEIFSKRFNELGGWTPELSKRIGWS